MTLKELTETLDELSQYRLALDLAEKALPIWTDYALSNKLEYRDTVIGMHHAVGKDILSRALEAVKREATKPKSRKREIEQLRAEFTEPIVAMQDFDWELPYAVERTFYAVRNLLDYVAGQDRSVFGESQIYLVINQTIDALVQSEILSESEIKTLLKKYITD